MLLVENLCYKNILKNINLNCSSGNIYGIFGPSGSGKTTLLKVIKNFINNWTGVITFNNKNVDLYDKSIGYTLQDSVFFGSMTIMDNFRLTGASHGEIYTMLQLLQLEHLVSKKLGQLSGGEKQRLSICRSLLLKPKILLMDEPTSALDDINVKLILDTIKYLVKNNNLICLIISHNINNMEIYDYIIHMNGGMITNIITNDNNNKKR